MSGLVLVALGLYVFSYIAGRMAEARQLRNFWRDFQYCPTCDRLSDELVAHVRREASDG